MHAPHRDLTGLGNAAVDLDVEEFEPRQFELLVDRGSHQSRLGHDERLAERPLMLQHFKGLAERLLLCPQFVDTLQSGLPALVRGDGLLNLGNGLIKSCDLGLQSVLLRVDCASLQFPSLFLEDNEFVGELVPQWLRRGLRLFGLQFCQLCLQGRQLRLGLRQLPACLFLGRYRLGLSLLCLIPQFPRVTAVADYGLNLLGLGEVEVCQRLLLGSKYPILRKMLAAYRTISVNGRVPFLIRGLLPRIC